MLAIELVAQGLIQGSIYALVALGLTLVYGLLRILHVAHAALFTLGGYVGVLVCNASGSLALGFLMAALVAGFGGVAMFRLAYQPLLSKPPFVALIASIGLFIAAEEAFRIIFGAQGMSFTQPALQQQFVQKLTAQNPGVSVHRVNEMYTSKMAAQAMITSGVKQSVRKDKGTLDKISAAILLQSWLDYHRG